MVNNILTKFVNIYYKIISDNQGISAYFETTINLQVIYLTYRKHFYQFILLKEEKILYKSKKILLAKIINLNC